MIPTYSEPKGKRLACHLKPGDRILCTLGPSETYHYREVLDVTVAYGKGAPVFVQIAVPEAPGGCLDVQLGQDDLLHCRPAQPHLAVVGGDES